jgi:hypothetical protein
MTNTGAKPQELESAWRWRREFSGAFGDIGIFHGSREGDQCFDIVIALLLDIFIESQRFQGRMLRMSEL